MLMSKGGMLKLLRVLEYLIALGWITSKFSNEDVSSAMEMEMVEVGK